jgi:hypothetical protein
MPTILDFHIRPVAPPARGAISEARSEAYQLDVFSRGNTQPLAHATFDYDLSYMTAFELNRLDVDAKDPQGRLERLQAFGAKLYANAEIGHNIAVLPQARGDYGAALAEYEISRKVLEEIGDRAGVATSHGQMGQLFVQIKKFPEAFEHLLLALSLFVELQSPYAQTAINALKNLRQKWGAKKFDAAWRDKTGEEVPEGLK